MSIITLATDYGSADGYTAAVKGVIKSIVPSAEISEVTDDLHGITKASLVLTRYYSRYPEGTIHLVIVDPTVGGSRKALIGFDDSYYFVGPDNGVFSRIIAANPESRWWEIDTKKLPTAEISNTFHGRDIFAPAAAMLVKEASPEKLGTRINKPVVIDFPEPLVLDDGIEGEVIDIDHFGNLITNIGSDMVGKEASIIVSEDLRLDLAATFSDVEEGNPLAYKGSLGYIEIAVRSGRASSLLDISPGHKIKVVS